MQAESEGEKKLAEILKQSFSASQIAVKDISGQYTTVVKICLVLSPSNNFQRSRLFTIFFTQEDVVLCMKYLLNLKTSEGKDKYNNIDLSIK